MAMKVGHSPEGEPDAVEHPVDQGAPVPERTP